MSGTGLRLTRGYAGRVVHINTTPRPSNIGESREICHLLSQFGEVEHFRSLRYDKVCSPNAAMVIFKEVVAAQRCVEKSGLQFTLGEEIEQTSTRQCVSDDSFESRLVPLLSGSQADTSQQADCSEPSGLPTPPARKPFVPYRGGPHLDEPRPPRLFTMYAHPPNMDMRANINMGWFHGYFQPNYRKTPNDDLAGTVPIKSMACVDWRQDKRPGLAQKMERAQDESGPNRWIPLRQLHDEYMKKGPTPQKSG